MPCIISSNNRALPPNVRASDYAAFAVEKLADVQQQKMMAAFRVQGIRSCIYNHHTSGEVCSCQKKLKKINTRLGKDGKASVGMINQLLQGGKYDIAPYGKSFDDFDEPFIEDNPVNPIPDENGFVGTVDNFLESFDDDGLGLTDVFCPICFGTGFVGGYSLFRGFRKVITVENFEKMEGEIRFETSPFSAFVTMISAQVVLPKGAVSVDAFRLLNGKEQLNHCILLDGKEISYQYILACCDGKEHTISCCFEEPTIITHLEIQLNLSEESSYIELPKLQKSGNRSILDSTDNFQIILSPDVPQIEPTDIIIESMWGKALMVQDKTWMNTRNRQMFGYEINVRVIQPAELFYLLPKRKPITQNTTTNPVISNWRYQP